MAEVARIRKLDSNQVTLVVKLDIRELRVRMAIGLWLIKLGAKVIGLGIEVEPLSGPKTGGTGSGTCPEG